MTVISLLAALVCYFYAHGIGSLLLFLKSPKINIQYVVGRIKGKLLKTTTYQSTLSDVSWCFLCRHHLPVPLLDFTDHSLGLPRSPGKPPEEQISRILLVRLSHHSEDTVTRENFV